MQYVRLGFVSYVTMADAPALGPAYSGAEAGRIHPQELAPGLRTGRVFPASQARSSHCPGP